MKQDKIAPEMGSSHKPKGTHYKVDAFRTAATEKTVTPIKKFSDNFPKPK